MTKFLASLKILTILSILCVIGSFVVLIFFPRYSSFGIGLALAAVTFGILELASRD